jgi:P-type Cu2+ transporter
MAARLSPDPDYAAAAAGGIAPVPEAAPPGHCAHCDESLEGVHVVRRDVAGQARDYCCLGCAFIAEQIAVAREQLGIGEPAPVAAPAHPTGPARPLSQAQLAVRGMVCSACALLVEAKLRALSGVSVANVDFVSRRATVLFDRDLVDEAALARCIEKAGYPVQTGASGERDRRARRTELLRVMGSWLLMMQVMMLAVPGYLAGPGEISPDLQQLLRIAQIVLTAPAVFFCAAPFWKAALSQIRARQVGMDVPIAAGLAVAAAASVHAVVAGRGEVYCDSITMFVALVLSVRWWQQRSMQQASAHVDAAGAAEVAVAQRLCDRSGDGSFEAVPADRLQPGDRVIVAAGSRIPADGRVIEGRSSVSQAWLTGESSPLDVMPGGRVLAGSLNLDQPLVVEVSRAGDRTSLAGLKRMVVEAASHRPPLVELANLVAARFVVVLLLASAATALGWALASPADLSAAVRNTVAVLIVTCPCALAMAVPLASACAQSALARRGVLVARPSALEVLARTTTVAIDKTGTLTEAEPSLSSILSLSDLDDPACLRVAASLEARSVHPYARALVKAARQAGVSLAAVSQVTEAVGAGVEGTVAGRRYRFGKPDFALGLCSGSEAGGALGSALARMLPDGGAGLVLADDQGPLALIRFGETIRAGAQALMDSLRDREVDVLVLSGDRRESVQAIASRLDTGTGLTVHAEQSPARKRELILRLQKQGRRVTMIGDGINDAPVLAQADASIAMASGADLARARADLVCLRPRLDDIAFAFDVARRASSVVRANLVWALGYNALMVPLAIAGRLSPPLAAAGMAASSLAVVVNSMRLQRAGKA